MIERQRRVTHRVAAILPCVGLLLLAALSIHEWWLIGYTADAEAIAAYRFGSDAMVGNGGPHYRSPELYAASALRFAGVLVLLTCPFVVALWLRSRRALITAYVILIVAATLNQLVPHAL